LNRPKVLITDHAWPDLSIERQALEAAGLDVVAGPAAPAPAEHIAALCREHQPVSILTCWAQVQRAAIDAVPGLRHVGRLGVGLDNIDVRACTERGIPVTNVPDYCFEEVSDHALALALAWSRGIVAFDRRVRAGEWNPAAARLRRMARLTVGVVGYGRIGQATARKFRAFGSEVLVHTRTVPTETDGLDFVALDALLARSDVVVLNLPLTPATQHLFDAARIASMKAGSLLINLSRGGVVDTQALIDALDRGHLAGAGLDVLESEPAVPPALLRHEQVVITPHVAFSSDASLEELRQRGAEEAIRALRGEPLRYGCNGTPSFVGAAASAAIRATPGAHRG
jgi:D-3-phosphoglycerate dehydrogenase